MTDQKIRIAIFTARNLVTTSDCSPETIKNLLDTLNPAIYSIDILLVDKFVPPALQVTEDALLHLPMYIPFETVLSHKNVAHTLFLENLTFGQLANAYDMAIVAIYNDLGEDGKILGLLDTIGLPYLSPSLKVSAVCFDKSYTRALIAQNGGKIPPGFLVHKKQFDKKSINKRILSSIKYPIIIKPASSGNSYGVSLIRSIDEIDEASQAAFSCSDELLVEKQIIGQEYTIGIVGSYLNPIALPVVQINSQKDFFDYEAKYTPGKAEEICPAQIEDALKIKLQEAAVNAYKAVKGDSHARIDVILSNDKEVYILDINTFPGLNSASLFPKELKAVGSSLSQFLDEQIRLKIKQNKSINVSTP